MLDSRRSMLVVCTVQDANVVRCGSDGSSVTVIPPDAPNRCGFSRSHVYEEAPNAIALCLVYHGASKQLQVLVNLRKRIWCDLASHQAVETSQVCPSAQHVLYPRAPWRCCLHPGAFRVRLTMFSAVMQARKMSSRRFPASCSPLLTVSRSCLF